MVREVADTGLSIAKVARRNGIHPSVLGRWCQEARAGKAGVPALVPVAVADAASEAKPRERREVGTAEIVLRNGRRLIVAEDVPARHLAALVTALEAV